MAASSRVAASGSDEPEHHVIQVELLARGLDETERHAGGRLERGHAVAAQRWSRSGSAASTDSRSATRSTMRSSAPRWRGPSASNSVSFPSFASIPTSVKVSVSSITCMPRWSHRNVASGSRSSTQRATWSRLVGAKVGVIARTYP